MTNEIKPAELAIEEPTTPGWHAWGGRLLVALFALWIFNIVWAAQIVPWFVVGSGLSDSRYDWVWANVIQVGLTAVPLLPFAWKWPLARYRAIFRAWLLACLLPLLLAPTRLFLPVQSQAVLFTQIGGALLLLAVTRGRLAAAGRRPAATWLATAAAVFVCLPWFAWGALGSALDTLLSLGLGLLLGGITAVLGGLWLHTLSGDSHGLGWDLLTGGLVLGTLLLILASGLSFNGGQLLLMVVLPGLGWAMMATAVTGGQADPAHHRPPGLLAGLAAALILALADTDGLYLNAFDGILRWSFQAAFVSAALALAAGLGFMIIRHRLPGSAGHGRILPALALCTVVLGVLIYLSAGQPGLYGDRLFVILKDQADVSAAATLTNYEQRRQFVYDTLTNHAQSTQADLRQSLERLGVDYTPYYLVNAVEVRGGWPHRLWLSSHPAVDRVLPSPVLRPVPSPIAFPAEPAPPPSDLLWNQTQIGADQVWRQFGARGQGIIIGQSDSGVQWEHPELRDGYLGGPENHDGTWLDPWEATAVPADISGHGTHTLGTILGNNVGIAPDAQWFACANLIRNLGNPALYLDCMQFMLAPYPQGGDPFRDGRPAQSAHVLNNSWGCPQDYEGCDARVLVAAVEALRHAGLFVVASAGNDGPACSTIDSPIALYDAVFSVGAVDSHNNIAAFSSTGPVIADGSGRIKPDIAAPGVDIVSAWPGNKYALSSGTSMAGPHVAGVVALLWSANPALIGDIAGTEAILQQTATPYRITAVPPTDLNGLVNLEDSLMGAADPTGDTCLAQTDITAVPNSIAGYGIVNAYEAVKLALPTP